MDRFNDEQIDQLTRQIMDRAGQVDLEEVEPEVFTTTNPDEIDHNATNLSRYAGFSRNFADEFRY